MKPSRRTWIALAVVLIAGGLLASLQRERLWLASLYFTGRSPHCSFWSAIDTLDHERRLTAVKDRILAASRLLETDAQGFRHWQTPKGNFWIPPGQDYGLPFNLSEQENKIYGTGPRAVQPGDVVLDCGANVGVFTREALAAGARLVVAIEPAPENLECLRRNLSQEVAAGRVVIYEKGVWDKDDFLTINVAPNNPAADSFVLMPEGAVPSVKLPLTTIDKLVQELKLDRVDYIKMDIEGAEQQALAGARETLRRFHPRLSLSSYHRPDDPERIPVLVREAWDGYRMECGPCTYANGILRPDVLYFR
ncbi:MAG: FkbM family methyltransferase [Bryobacteraceae bacterium]|nr:FkbM family methyltransferase [Bryobacteraceae bacterium]